MMRGLIRLRVFVVLFLFNVFLSQSQSAVQDPLTINPSPQGGSSDTGGEPDDIPPEPGTSSGSGGSSGPGGSDDPGDQN